MNDHGLDEPIENSAKEVERNAPSAIAGSSPDGVDEDEEYTEPSRWWFASTAFPLIAGTFGPMASAFNVCALAANWRVTIAPGQSEDNGDLVEDPKWLIGINAVSLVLALVANFALLLNMARRLRFAIAQPITIIGWYISSFILMGLTIAASHAPSFQLPAEQNPALTQAFYYAIMASALYFIISCLMVVTVYGTDKGHYPQEFKLTMSQRTLMVQTIAFLIYMIAGGAIFARIEGWLFLNGVYWANTTLLTIGTGDFSPKSHTGQSLIFPFAIGGIVFLGLVIGSIRSLILERGKKKLGARMVEKKREQVISHMDKSKGTVKVSRLQTPHDVRGDEKSEMERRKEEFRVMRLIQEHSSTKRKWMSLGISTGAWFTLWFVGAVVFWVAERNQQGLSYFESLYFSYISLLTIGYGDYAPVANSSKAFFVFWSLLAVPTLTILISNMGDTVIKSIRDVTLWLSEITVLPGDASMMDRVKDAARIATKDKVFGSDDEKAVKEAPSDAFMPQEDPDLEGGDKAQKQRATDGIRKATDRLGKEYEAVELEEFEAARSRGDGLAQDVHLHHYLLVREIRNVIQDVSQSPPKKYSYNEWAWFLRLLGEDEADDEFHHMPHIEADVADFGGKGVMGEKQRKQWSWIGSRSPLMGEMDEPEWLLEKLSNKLEGLLRDERIKQKPKREAALIEDLPPGDGNVRNKGEAPPADEGKASGN